MTKQVYILILLFLSGCNTITLDVTEEELPFFADLSEVKYSETSQSLSDFVESIEYIRLSEKPLIPDLGLSLLFIDKNDNIYFYKENINKYNSNGKFIKTLLKKGQGPSEVNFPIMVVFNANDNYFLIKDYGLPYYKIFSINGDYLGKEDYVLSNTGIYKEVFAFWKDKEFFRYRKIGHEPKGEKVNKDSMFFFNVRDLKTKETKIRFKNWLFNIKGIVVGGPSVETGFPFNIGNISDSLMWIRPMKLDTIFYTKDGVNILPYYTIKEPKDAAGYEFKVKVEAGIRNYPMTELMSKLILGEIIVIDSGILFRYEKGNETGVGFCPKNGKAKSYSKTFKNDIDDCLEEIDFILLMKQNRIYEKDGYLYFLVNAFEFFKESCNPPFPDLTEESNPVVVKLKLKK